MTTSFTLTCGMNSSASSIASNTFCSHLESLAAIMVQSAAQRRSKEIYLYALSAVSKLAAITPVCR